MLQYNPPVSPAQSISTPSLSTPASSPSSSSWADSDSSPSPSPSEHIKRPPNAFMIFRSAFLRSKKIPAEETNQQQTLSRIIGQTWGAMTADEKAFYNEAADAAKREHRMRYPNYKYSPAASKVKSKAKMEKKIGKVSAEEVTRIRMQYTNVKGPVLSSPRSAKKARGVKANARALATAVDESAFNPMPQVAPAMMGFTDYVQHGLLGIPSGPPSFEPQTNPDVLQHGAYVFNPLYDECMQLSMNGQYDTDPSFKHEAYYNGCALGPAFQPAMSTSLPISSFPAQQTGSFSNEPLSAYNSQYALDTGSSCVPPSPINDYVLGTILTSPDGTSPFDKMVEELVPYDRVGTFFEDFPTTYGPVNEGIYPASQYAI
ncbi:hypothetical protein HYPSUDRAFT_73491 [Hypholoma sublateritium FD-334 SS-4]|uniref:HMG box domain-containing protein n=1 Tax=Hypholoma sublateritium (strain FD-334 SS-4) TaxID=945553 RepID=A0A0D2QEI2_HYPSF|nr:hypothetical protein HYPSUDRAFT_73491 [Hypholoma sublateritium FD-334 SS-4]